MVTTTEDSQKAEMLSHSQGKNNLKPERIGIHCLAGLGRAPVLVAIALIHYGSSPENAIILVRKHRQGAINHSQAHFILNYEKPGKTMCYIF
jgi:protein tyrosine phosphatase type IVA